MIKLIPDSIFIDFLSKRLLCLIGSAVLIVATIVLLFVNGLNYGIDFAGGTLIQIQTEQEPDVADVRSALEATGMKGLSIQQYGSADEFLIRSASGDAAGAEDMAETIKQELQPVAGETTIRRVEFVGPQIGDELRKKGLLAMLLSLGAILFYISIRFEVRYGVGAIVALCHDVILTVGVFSLLQKEVTLPVLAALMTVIGYSLNDTIVVFDRVREARRKYRSKELVDVLNISINDMLNRTLMTSLTTLVVLMALFYFGGSVIHDFAFTLMFGVIVGTYSSIFIASPVVLWMEKYYKNRPEDDESQPKPSVVVTEE